MTLEAVTFATTVDSLQAVKYLVVDEKICTMAELVQAIKDDWLGHEIADQHNQCRYPAQCPAPSGKL